VGQFMQELGSWDAVEQAMGRMNLAWGRVRHAGSMPEQPTVQARGSIVQIDDRAGSTRPITQSPYRFSDALSGVRGPAPHRGEHNREVLSQWLDMAPSAIDALLESGVLQRDEDPTD